MDMRTPMSRVRSVTETSMMFMTPMPPTKRLTPATADRKPVSTPVTPEITRLFAVVSVKSRIPGFLIRPIVQPVALYIFGQDVKVLKLQTELKGQMGDRYVSTEVDLLGPHISRLLKRAEDGELDQLEPYRREVTMLV